MASSSGSGPAALNTVRYGEPSGRPPLVVAHGLFGSARNWSAIGKRLARKREVLAVDMRNHGASPHHGSHDYPSMADDLAAVIAAAGGTADLLGHSMGGKAAMVLALSRPELVGRLIVADIAPAAYGHSQMPLVEAMRALDLSDVTRRGEADARLAEAVPEPDVRAFLLQSLEIDDKGARWRLNLDTLARDMALIMGFPEMSGRFVGPALFVTGADSDYLGDTHWPEIRARFPKARHEAIAGAGHWVHAEAPREFVAVVEAFLAEA
jgi:esterase